MELILINIIINIEYNLFFIPKNYMNIIKNYRYHNYLMNTKVIKIFYSQSVYLL